MSGLRSLLGFAAALLVAAPALAQPDRLYVADESAGVLLVDLAVTPETVLPLSWSSLPPTPSDIANVGRDDLAIADCADLSARHMWE